jgi:outer membrane protein TolC
MNKKLLLSLSATALLAGCAVKPEPLTLSDLQTTAERNFQTVDADQEPVAAPIDLYEAMARALKYNLDYKVELMDEALKSRELDLSRYDMLPQLVASGGYAGRNNFSGANRWSRRRHRRKTCTPLI